MTEDGSIVINTKIRTDGIKAGAQEIEAGLRRAANRVDNLGTSAKNAINKQIDAFAKLNNEYSAPDCGSDIIYCVYGIFDQNL